MQGYALIEYTDFNEAQAAINEFNGKEYLGQQLGADWAFVRPPAGSQQRRRCVVMFAPWNLPAVAASRCSHDFTPPPNVSSSCRGGHRGDRD